MTQIDWPASFSRTAPQERKRTNKYEATLGATTTDLETQLDIMDVDDWSVSFGNQHMKSNGMPQYNANPDDPGFVLRWSKGGDQYAVACDNYTELRDNVRTVYLWLKETRMRSDRPVVTGSDEFAAARLPAGDEPIVADEPPHEVLGVSPEASSEEVRSAFRRKVMEAHPDTGGSEAEVKRVQEAKERMLR